MKTRILHEDISNESSYGMLKVDVLGEGELVPRAAVRPRSEAHQLQHARHALDGLRDVEPAVRLELFGVGAPDVGESVEWEERDVDELPLLDRKLGNDGAITENDLFACLDDFVAGRHADRRMQGWDEAQSLAHNAVEEWQTLERGSTVGIVWYCGNFLAETLLEIGV